MVGIRAVIFDMDGVLIDAKEWHYEALNRALRLFGTAISRDDHLTTFDGLPTRRKLQILTKQRQFPSGLHALVNTMKQIYTMDLVAQHCQPCLHHQAALAQLRSDGYILAVASNSIRASVDVMLAKADLLEYLHFTLSNQDVANPKPAPDIYLEAARRAGARPEECVVVEDNERGVEAARRAGTHVLQVESVDDVRYARIRAFIDSLAAARSAQRRAA